MDIQDKPKLAKSIVGHSLVVRKDEQSLNMESVFIVMLIVGIAWFYLWRINVRIEKNVQRQSAVETRIASGGNPYDIGGLADLVITTVPTLTPSPIPTATQTPLPTLTLEPKRELVFLKLSFYDPNIGSIIPEIADINCMNFDHVNRVCLSTMANGVPFGAYYGRAVACPPPMQFGDVLEVIYPVQLTGNWVCMDRGWAIENGYVDFLLRYPDQIWTGYNLNNFPWSSTVQAYWVHP